MRHRHPVALDVRAAHRGGVEEGVDEVVVQQVDLVDVEHAAVGVGEQAGLVGAHALGQRALEVERADEPVLGRADRQLDEPGRVPGRSATAGCRARPGSQGRARGVAAEPASRDDVEVGQQRGQRAHGRRLRRALLAPHQHAADPGCTALSSRARRRSSWPTTALNGNVLVLITARLPDRT